MAIEITGVDRGSPAGKAGITSGQRLVSINGNRVADVLDYRFYMIDTELDILLEGGDPACVHISKGEYAELGLEFSTYLMDTQHTCRNKCVFCFVDQLPGGLRRSLYVKDDDSRMSFLFGSYVTLTNMKEEDIRRIIKMRLSPINISVHSTDPELRCRLLGNRFAGETLRYLPMLTEAGIEVNTQIVICPGLNDGEQLRRSISDLTALGEHMASVALVPVGLTCHREGLYPLRLLTPREAGECIDIADEFGERLLKEWGVRKVYPADELYVTAGRPIPDYGYYDDFPQLDNGIGITAMMRREFSDRLEELPGSDAAIEVSTVCGAAAGPLLEETFAAAKAKYPNLTVHIYPVPNRLFGETVTVTGLLCGRDILSYLKGRPLGSRLILSSVMLRHEKDLFLDDMHIDDFRKALNAPVQVLEPDGGALLSAAVEESDA